MNGPTDLRELFDRAVNLPKLDRVAFLDQMCGRNAALRSDVERLLAANDRLGSILKTSPAKDTPDLSCGILAPERLTLASGVRLGPYEITEPLGVGGMGEVYKARDTRLDRTVALKVLPRELTDDSTARQRFEREARAVAALSHPHICPLFDVGRQDEVDYLVMEYLEGETLATRLTRGKLPLQDAVNFGIQIADALGAAHRAGIIHRDLKPGNIMLTSSGARLLDFGLAKRGHPPVAGTVTDWHEPALTKTGIILGTVQYMAPEQLEGRDMDERTDVFTFGVVLYEMLTGRRAFEGTSDAAVIANIIRTDPPPPSTLEPNTPPALDWLVRRCLAKDPNGRWQSFSDIRTRLVATHAVAKRRFAYVAALPILASVVAAGTALWRAEPVVPRVAAIRRLTYDRILKEGPHTDGTRIFYVSWLARGQQSSLFQMPLKGGEPVPLPTPFTRPYIVDVSAEQGELLVADGPEGPRQIYVMPTLGGQPRPLGDIQADFSALSVDGRQIAFSKGTQLFIGASDGSNVRQLLTAAGHVALPRLSPDGRRLRYTVVDSSGPTIWEAAADGSGVHAVLPKWKACCGRWTADGRYYVFEAERNGEHNLWVLPEKASWPWARRTEATPVKLTTGPMRYENPVPSHDGTGLLALGTPPGAGELVRFDQLSGQFVPFLSGLSARDVEFSRDGRWIAYVSHPDLTLWRSHPDGRNRRQLTFPPNSVALPRWSPDGRQIAYASRVAGGSWKISIVSAEGGKPVQITAGDRSEVDPNWSPEGKRLVLGGIPGEHTADHPIRIHILDVESRKQTTVPGSDGLFSPRWSPDGRSIAALSTDYQRLLLYEFSTGQWREVIGRSNNLGYPNWTRSGNQIQLQQGSTIVRVRASDGRIAAVAGLDGVTQVISENGAWLGVASDDSPLALRELTSAPEIYVLELDWR